MYKSLYFKIILILVIFMVTVMCVIGTVLINNVNNFYMDDFTDQMEESFADGAPLTEELKAALSTDDYDQEPDGSIKVFDTSKFTVGGVLLLLPQYTPDEAR